MCEHDFQLNAEGQVTCTKCLVRDDEMELPVEEVSSRMIETPEFWASQTNFEE